MDYIIEGLIPILAGGYLFYASRKEDNKTVKYLSVTTIIFGILIFIGVFSKGTEAVTSSALKSSTSNWYVIHSQQKSCEILSDIEEDLYTPNDIISKYECVYNRKVKNLTLVDCSKTLQTKFMLTKGKKKCEMILKTALATGALD